MKRSKITEVPIYFKDKITCVWIENGNIFCLLSSNKELTSENIHHRQASLEVRIYMEKPQTPQGHRRKSLVNTLGACAAILYEDSFVLIIMLFILGLFFSSPRYSSACGRSVQEWDYLFGWDMAKSGWWPYRTMNLHSSHVEKVVWQERAERMVKSNALPCEITEQTSSPYRWGKWMLSDPETVPGRDNYRSNRLSLEKAERKKSELYSDIWKGTYFMGF